MSIRFNTKTLHLSAFDHFYCCIRKKVYNASKCKKSYFDAQSLFEPCSLDR